MRASRVIEPAASGMRNSPISQIQDFKQTPLMFLFQLTDNLTPMSAACDKFGDASGSLADRFAVEITVHAQCVAKGANSNRAPIQNRSVCQTILTSA